VGGRVRSLGAAARVEDLADEDLLKVKKLVELSGFDHVDPQNVTRIASAKQLYSFDALKSQRY